MTAIAPMSPEYTDAPTPHELLAASEREEESRFSVVDLRSIWAAVYRNRYLILAIFVTALLLGTALTLLATPRYEARASIQIDQQTTRVLGTEDQDTTQIGTEADRFLQTQVDVLKSRALAGRVSDSLGLASSDRFLLAMGVRPRTDPAAGTRGEQVLDTLQDNLTVNLPRNSRVVEIRFTSPDPALAARIANRYSSDFIANNIQQRYSTTSYARAFLQNQLEQARQRLERSEQDLNSYARAAQLVDTSAVTGPEAQGTTARSPTLANLVQVNQAYAAAQAARAQAQQRWEQASAVPTMSLPEVLSNPAINTLTQQRAVLTGTLAALRQRLTPQHPSIVQAAAQLDDTQRQIATLAASIRASIRNQYEIAARQETALRERVAALQGATFSEQDRGVRYNILRRETDTNRQLYDSLLNRYKEVSAAAGVVANNISPVDTAEPPRTPVSPRVKLNLGLAAFVGLGLAALLVAARQLLDDSVRSPLDFEEKLQLPLLGVVPNLKGEGPVEALDEARSPVREAYHAVRTAIELTSSEGVPKTILVTSSRKGEGKTTSSFALARDFANVGRRTLLIDADMRNPSLHQIARVEQNNVGFSSVLARQVGVEQVLQVHSSPMLTLLVGGPTPPDPAQLLAGDWLPQLLAQLEHEFDVIILDGPPVLLLADAVQLGSYVNAVVFIAEAGGAHFGQAKNALRRLRRSGARVIGGVLTKFNSKEIGYNNDYYGYRYTKS